MFYNYDILYDNFNKVVTLNNFSKKYLIRNYQVKILLIFFLKFEKLVENYRMTFIRIIKPSFF